MRRFLTALWLLLLPFTLPAQSSTDDWEELFAQLVALDEEWTERQANDAYEVLASLAEHPVDLNTATRDDLEGIPFLTDDQIEALIAYRDRCQRVRTMAELALIPAIDGTRRALLPYFLTLSEDKTASKFPSAKTITERGKHTLVGQLAVPFYHRQGDRSGYLGPRYRHGLRYTFQYGRFLQAGLTAAQDAGEPFFAGKNGWGYDHYSFYAVARNVTEHVKTLAVGRFRVRMGLGLALNNDVSMGKSMALSSLFRPGSTIRPHASRTDWNYLQGGAAEIALSRELTLSAFASWRKRDATLTRDGEGIATLLKTGYHRTTSEMERKHNVAQTATGGHIGWRRGPFHLGATGVWTRFDKPLVPNTAQDYRRYYPEGTSFWNASLDYGYTAHRFSLSGETATGDCGALATLNAAAFRASNALTLTAIQRYYSYRYTAVMGQSFADGGSVQNESGVMMKVDWSPGGAWTVTAYTDYAYFPWEKYQAKGSSHSWDNFAQATYQRSRWQFTARYRFRVRTKDNAEKTRLINETTQRGRIAVAYSMPSWSVRTQIDAAHSAYKQKSSGWMVTQSATWQGFRAIQASAVAAYFHTDDYASRLYAYERGLLYAFSFPAFYGEGVHYGLWVRADVSRKWMFIAKLGVTDYFDRDHISSGKQRIDRSSKTDLELQLRLRW